MAVHISKRRKANEALAVARPVLTTAIRETHEGLAFTLLADHRVFARNQVPVGAR